MKTFAALIFSQVLYGMAAGQIIVYEQMPGASSYLTLNSSTLDNFGKAPGFRVADDFLLLSNTVIDVVNWWGEPLFGSNEFQLAFYTDVGGFPGSIVHTSGGSLSSTSVNVGSPSDPVIFYSSVLNSPFSAQSGEMYWLSVFNKAPDASWVWLRADDIGNGARQGKIPGAPWGFDWPNMGFQLAAIPEPSSLLLAAMATVALLVRLPK